MEFSDYFPIWDKLTESQQILLSQSAVKHNVKKGTVLHNTSLDCLGFIVIKSGRLRGYMISEEGREITLYRLFEYDMCLFAASCIMNSLQFDITIETEKDSEIWIIPPEVYRSLMDESAAVANYTSDLMASRFSEVMWLIEQIMWKSFDKRLAAFLIDECMLEDTDVIKMTHEKLASHLGTAREVVTRMLKYFQNENMIELSRGSIKVTDEKKLRELSEM